LIGAECQEQKRRGRVEEGEEIKKQEQKQKNIYIREAAEAVKQKRSSRSSEAEEKQQKQ
jgi:hypothetical protein